MKVQKWELANKIKKLRAVVPKQATLPILQNILVDNGTLTATNMELTISTKLEGSEGETMLIPAKAFGLIDQLPNGEVEIIKSSKKGRNAIMIRAGSSIKNAFETLDHAEFPRSSNYAPGDQQATIDGDELTNAIRNVLYAVAKVSDKPSMCAVCMECKAGALSTIGLNGQQVAWDRIPYEGDFRLLIPRSAAEQLISLGIEGDVIISYSNMFASFETAEYVVQTRLVDGNYFNVDKMFRWGGRRVELLRDSVSKAIRRADMCNEEVKHVPVRLDLEADSLRVYINSSSAAYSEELPIESEEEGTLTIGFNPAILRAAIDAFADEKIDAWFSSPKSPVIMKSRTRDFRALVLPVLIK